MLHTGEIHLRAIYSHSHRSGLRHRSEAANIIWSNINSPIQKCRGSRKIRCFPLDGNIGIAGRGLFGNIHKQCGAHSWVWRWISHSHAQYYSYRHLWKRNNPYLGTECRRGRCNQLPFRQENRGIPRVQHNPIHLYPQAHDRANRGGNREWGHRHQWHVLETVCGVQSIDGKMGWGYVCWDKRL